MKWEIRCSHGGKDSSVGHFGCNAVWTYGYIPTLRRNILPPSSGRQNILPKRHLATSPHGVIMQKTKIDNKIISAYAVETLFVI
jgi:hypothetical protein